MISLILASTNAFLANNTAYFKVDIEHEALYSTVYVSALKFIPSC
jgi:hypothetical protein